MATVATASPLRPTSRANVMLQQQQRNENDNLDVFEAKKRNGEEECMKKKKKKTKAYKWISKERLDKENRTLFANFEQALENAASNKKAPLLARTSTEEESNGIAPVDKEHREERKETSELEKSTTTTTTTSSSNAVEGKQEKEEEKEEDGTTAVMKESEGGRTGTEGDQVLRLHNKCTEFPFLDFGSVALGSGKCVYFEAYNDSSERQELQLDRMPTDKGFALTGEGLSSTATSSSSDLDDDYDDGTYVLNAHGRAQIGVRWCPTELGSFREVVYFKLKSNKSRLQCIVFGKCIDKEEEEARKSSGQQSRKRFLSGCSKLKLGQTLERKKKAKIDEREAARMCRSRPGFSSFHTDLWMQKQERAFTAWLNFVFLTQITSSGGDQASVWNNCHFDAKMQNKLWNYYTKDRTLKKVMMDVETLVDSGKLALKRSGASLFTDIRIQKHAVNSIMAYNPFWLRQGLQAVLGAQMPISESYTDSFLKEIVSNFLIDDQLVSRKFSRNGTQDGLFKAGYAKARAQTFLKKFLLMVKLLDQIMMEENAYEVPLLFRSKAKIKSSKDMVQNVLNESLHGEGNVLRHLKFHGYLLSYGQAPLLEFDFKISNLAIDLRDGVRLSKLVDYMNDKREDLVAKAKISSTAKAARTSNTVKVFAQMNKLGVSLNGVASRFGLLDLKPKDIVEGDQELTLHLLWRVMRDWQIPKLVKDSALEVEIDRIKGTRSFGDSYFRRDESVTTHAGESTIVLLLKWVQTICAGHGVRVSNFTSSFADGYVLCLIANCYAPKLLNLKRVCEVDGDSMLDNRSKSEKEISQVKTNFAVMHECVNQLGGLPKMLSYSDFDSHGPDENSVISFLAFLAFRLMQLSKEERSAILIQRRWKKTNAPHVSPRQTLHSWINSARVIQRAWARYLERKFTSAEWLLKVQSAVKIQRAYKNMREVRLARFQMMQKRAIILKLQACFRMRKDREAFLVIKQSATLIQTNFRACLARKYFRDSFLIPKILSNGYVRKCELQSKRMTEKMAQSATKIQASYRMILQKKATQKFKQAILVTQKYMRRSLVAKHMNLLHDSALMIQSSFRSLAARQLLAKHKAAMCVQKHFKGFIARKNYQHAHVAATKIQASYRMHLQLVQFRKDMSGIVRAQSTVRTWLVKQSMMRQSEAALVIENGWMNFVRSRNEKLDRNALIIQKAYRGFSARSTYKSKQEKILIIQKHFRSFKCKRRYKRYLKMKKAMEDFARAAKLFTVKSAAAIKIQSKYRGFICRRQLKTVLVQKEAATTIQSFWKCHAQKRMYQQILDARSVFRKWLPFLTARTHFLQMKKSALLIQSSYREHYHRRVVAAQAIQNYARTMISRRNFNDTRSSIVKIQSHFRSYRVRCSCSKELKSIRLRLLDASTRVKSNPKLSIGYQTSTALQGLMKANSVLNAISFCKVLGFSTKYSSKCCLMLCENTNAVTALLRFTRSCNRSEPHVKFLKMIMKTLENVIDCDRRSKHEMRMIEKLGDVSDIFTVLGELLQMFRGNEEVFLPTAQVLHELVTCKSANEADMSSCELMGMKKKLEGISQIMKQKLRLEKKYIDHMENKKGSDVSARESAKKVLQISRDLQSLHSILNCFPGSKDDLDKLVVDPLKAKNTIVRKAFMEKSNHISKLS